MDVLVYFCMKNYILAEYLTLQDRVLSAVSPELADTLIL